MQKPKSKPARLTADKGNKRYHNPEEGYYEGYKLFPAKKVLHKNHCHKIIGVSSGLKCTCGAESVGEEPVVEQPKQELPLNFWKRLEMFISNVEVNDPMSYEEKEMILTIAKAGQPPEMESQEELWREFYNRINQANMKIAEKEFTIQRRSKQ